FLSSLDSADSSSSVRQPSDPPPGHSARCWASCHRNPSKVVMRCSMSRSRARRILGYALAGPCGIILPELDQLADILQREPEILSMPNEPDEIRRPLIVKPVSAWRPPRFG